MSNSPVTIYTSTDPRVQEWWRQFHALTDAYHAAVQEFAREYPGYVLTEWVRPDKVRFLTGLKGEECPGPMWRLEKDVWVPALRVRGGVALKKRMESIRVPRLPLPGMPCDVWTNSRIYSFSIEELGGAYWATWNCEHERVETDSDFDPSLWTRAPQSAYWLAKEAEEVTPCVL